MNRTRIPLVFFLVGLSSCLKMSEEEQRKNMIEQPSLEASAEQSLTSPLFALGEWPSAAWWEQFRSEELNAMVVEALGKNPSIQSIRERVELAKQRAVSARSKLYPLVYFDADGNWQFVSKQGLQKSYNPAFPRHAHIIDLTLAFSYEFDFWDKYRNLFRAALSRELAERAELAQVELITAAALARSYFGLRANLAKQKIYQELYEVRQKLLLLRELLLLEAIDDARIVLLSKERAEEAKKWVLAIDEEVALSRHLVNLLMGKGPDEPIDAIASLPDLPQVLSIPENLSIDLLSRRPDLMAQIWRVESLAHEVGAARANFFPSINLAAIVGLSSVIYNLLFNQSSYEQSLVPTVSLPVYTAGDIQATLDAKRAEYQSAVFAYNELILKSAQEVADALVFAKSVLERSGEQSWIVLQASQRLTLAEDRLKSGLDNALQTLAQREEVLQQELEKIDLTYGGYAAAVALIRSLGGGYRCDE